MRNLRRSVLLITTLATALGVVPHVAIATDSGRPGPCALKREDDETRHHFSRRIIRCATDRWEVRGGAPKAICIARRESGLNPDATSETGQYLGLFQHDADAWPDRFTDWTLERWELRADALNGRSNAIVTIRMVHANGWSGWRGDGC